jgi:murein DD-endopeptidase MepM/ murein hydrolase activator NlpD
MSYNFDHPFCSPVAQLSFPPSPDYAYFNAPKRNGFNPTYQPGDEPGHAGIDLNGPLGSPALAAHDGKIVWAGRKPLTNWAAGKFIEILEETLDGFWLTRYLHLDTILVAAGDVVVRGDEIGTVGKTGQAASPHVHFETRWKDGTVAGYLPGKGVGWGTKLDPMAFGILEDDCAELTGTVWPALLRPGMSSDAVPILASLLVALGYRNIARRSYTLYGGWMVKQVKRFQRDNGLVVDGIVGPVTLDALYAAVAKTQ